MHQQTDRQDREHSVSAESPLHERGSSSVSADKQSRTSEAHVKDVGTVSKDEMPDSYVNAFGGLYYDQYMVFSATHPACSEEITVVCPAESEAEKSVVRKWTGADSLDEVVDSYIPVRHVRGNIYRVKPFGGVIMGKLPLRLVQSFCDQGLLTFDGTAWQVSPVIKAFTSSASLGAISPLLLLIYTAAHGPIGGISAMFGIMLYGICVSGWLLGYGRME